MRMSVEKDIMEVTSQEGTVFHFHADILVRESDYFRALMDSGMVESSVRKVSLPFISAASLQSLTTYCDCLKRTCSYDYNNLQDFKIINIDQDLIHAVTYLQMPNFLKVCQDCLISRLSHKNIFETQEIAETFSLAGVLVETKNFILKNIFEIWTFSKEEFCQYYMDTSKLSFVLENDDLICVNEMQVFNFVVDYTSYVLNHQETIIHVNLSSLFNCVRFPLINKSNFDQCRKCLETFAELNSSSVNMQTFIFELKVIFEKASAFFENCNLLYATPVTNLWTHMRCGVSSLVGCGGFTQTEKSTKKFLHVTTQNLEQSLVSGTHLEFQKQYYVQGRKYQLPCSVVEHGACMLNGCLYIAGGQTRYCQDGRYTTSHFFRFDPRKGSWQQLESMSHPRSLFYTGELDGDIYAVCGWTGPNSVTKSVEKYNVLTDSWQEMASAPVGLHEHAGCSHKGNLYVSGGYRGPFRGHLNGMWCYSPGRNSWSQRASLAHRRSYHVMASINDLIYVAGGVNYIGNDLFEDVLVMEVYDSQVDQWSDLDCLRRPASCMSHHVVRNHILLFGGHSFEDDSDHGMLQIYNTKTKEHSECPVTSDNTMYFPVVELPFLNVS